MTMAVSVAFWVLGTFFVWISLGAKEGDIASVFAFMGLTSYLASFGFAVLS